MKRQHVRRAHLLDPVKIDALADQSISSFNFFGKKVVEIPYNPQLLLKVVRARFVSCCLESVPNGLNKYRIISTLDLSDNFLTEVGKKFLSSFYCLETLNLASNCLTVFKPGPCPNLRVLDLSFNRGLKVSDIWQTELPRLETIKITHCCITELPSTAPKWAKQIARFYLDGNFLRELPSYFSEFRSLEELHLFGNKIESPLSIKTRQLKTLSLAYNCISEWNSPDVASETVNVSGNMFKVFPDTMLNLKGIRALIISRCELTGELNMPLPENIAALDVSHNEITGFGEKFIESMKHISTFKASFNKISKIADAFPEKCPLSQIFLDENDIEELPPSFANVEYIDTLSINNNKLRNIDSLRCTRMRVLDLSFNELESLPNVFETSVFLSVLNVSYNRLKTLPNSISNCKKLMELYASGNMISLIPRCIISFPQLRTLVMSNNNISSLPDFLGSSYFLTVLDLSCNSLTELPLFIEEFNTLEVLSLAHNRISKIEDFFMLPPTLRYLDLSYNKLENANLMAPAPSVQSLNLDCNNIKMFNPDDFPNAKFISLNSNPLNKPFSPLISSLALLPFRGSFEMLNCGKLDGEIPPLPYHMLSDSHVAIGKTHGIGYSATMGMRPTMEDVVALCSYNDDHNLYALFDGHQGNVTASIASVILVNETRKIIDEPSDSFPSKFSKIFADINNRMRNFSTNDGCTAVSSFIRGNECFTASVGDSRIIRVKKSAVERITTDYKPMMRCEFDRLTSGGLSISSDGRIDRKLAVSRTLGDFWCIVDRKDEQDQKSILFVEPEVTRFEIDDEDVALVIACDGVWDVLRDDIVANLVRESKSPQDAATRIRAAAFSMGSTDNISAMVVFVHPLDEYRGIVYKNEIDETVPSEDAINADKEYDQMVESPTAKPKRMRR